MAWREGLLFSALGAAGAIAGSWLALATRDEVQLWGFALVLVVAGGLMLRTSLRGGSEPTAHSRRPLSAVVTTAFVVGLFTGFFGVGGGFLVVPALTLILGMAMHEAAATALLVITLNCGFALIPRAGQALDGQAAVVVAAAVLVTSAVSARWSNRWSEKSLGVGFAALVLGMAALTVAQAAS